MIFFKDLNTKGSDEQQSTTLQNELPNDSNVHINGYISQNEIFKCMKNLKNNKACGEDEIINEYIKSTSNRFIHIYGEEKKIDTGTLPQRWLNGISKPIYQSKGDVKDPTNYRPITIASCLWKLFTAILNARLNDYTEKNS